MLPEISSIQEQPPTSQTRYPRIFRSLRHYNYRVWFIGQAVSLIGSWMQAMAQQVLVYRLTGTATSLGIISLVGLIPLIPVSLWAGSLCDRISKKKIILATQSVMAVQALILAFLTFTNLIQVWHVYVLAFFMGAAQAMDMPTRQAFTVELVGGKEDLSNAIGLNSAMFNMARAAGPALAGIIVAVTGEANAFLINGISFLSVIISLQMMRNLPNPPKFAQKPDTLKHMVEGLKYTKSHTLLMVLISMVAVSAFLSMPYSTLMPVFSNVTLRESAKPVIDAICKPGSVFPSCLAPEALPLGILLTFVGIGALIGALFIAAMQEHARRGVWLTVGNLLFPATLIVFASTKSFTVASICMLSVGFAFVMQNALANTLLQFASPDDKRGRIMSVYTLTFQSTMRLGGLQAGLMADWIGAPITVGITAILSLVYGIFIALRFPAIRKL